MASTAAGLDRHGEGDALSGSSEHDPVAPTVSVVMPARDAARTIDAAIASALSQSWRDLELIVVDDGSTDETAHRVAAVRDPRCRLVRRAHRGPSASRNHGAALARGEFVAFLDADDVWTPSKIARQVAALRARPAAAAAYGWVDYISAHSDPIGRDERATFDGDVYARLLAANFISSGSNVMFRRDALLDAGGFDESLAAVEDWDLHVRVAARHTFACVPAVLVHYRLTPTSLSARVEVMERSYRIASERIFAAAPESLRHLRPKSAASFYRYLAVRATDGGFDAWRAWAALRFAVLSAYYDPCSFARSLRTAPRHAFERLARRLSRPVDRRGSPA